MDVLGQILEDREGRRGAQAEADERWMRESAGIDSAERLLAWDRWLRGLLLKSLQWPKDDAARDRLVCQCATEITKVAKQLRGRGWLLDGHQLAEHVRALLSPVAVAQKAGKVGDFWPYFRASVGRYVGVNAEEIQAHARRSGSDEATQSFGAVLAGLGIGTGQRTRGASLTELLAERAVEIATAKKETIREKEARARARQSACKADADQPTLW